MSSSGTPGYQSRKDSGRSSDAGILSNSKANKTPFDYSEQGLDHLKPIEKEKDSKSSVGIKTDSSLNHSVIGENEVNL